MDEQEAFFLLHRDLPREGPGHRESTTTALFLAPTVPARPRVLDLGCGPGAQTLDLARLLPDAHVTAVDSHAPFLDELSRRAREAGLERQITPVLGDLADPPGDLYDIIWCEGAAYLMGFERALARWVPLLAPGGVVALTEPVWRRELPREAIPERARSFWAAYPGMLPREARRRQIAEMGLRCHGDFLLPDRDWWEDYYTPMAARASRLRAEHVPMPDVLRRVLDDAEEEMAVYREHGDTYGYAFFVVGRPEDDDLEA